MLRHAVSGDNGPSMTALSCLGIGIAFFVAVALLVFAGFLLGWVVPAVIERVRERRGDPPPNRD